jgi:hypothetical protein
MEDKPSNNETPPAGYSNDAKPHKAVTEPVGHAGTAADEEHAQGERQDEIHRHSITGRSSKR